MLAVLTEVNGLAIFLVGVLIVYILIIRTDREDHHHG